MKWRCHWITPHEIFMGKIFFKSLCLFMVRFKTFWQGDGRSHLQCNSAILIHASVFFFLFFFSRVAFIMVLVLCYFTLYIYLVHLNFLFMFKWIYCCFGKVFVGVSLKSGGHLRSDTLCLGGVPSYYICNKYNYFLYTCYDKM